MALVKVKPTSPGRRAVVKVVNSDLHKGAPYAGLLESQSKNAGRNNNGHVTTRHRIGFVASRNLPNVLVLEVNEADPVSLIRFPKVLMTKNAVAKFEEILG